MSFTCPPLPEGDLPRPLAVVGGAAAHDPALPLSVEADDAAVLVPARLAKAPPPPRLHRLEGGPARRGAHASLRRAVPDAVRIKAEAVLYVVPEAVAASCNESIFLNTGYFGQLADLSHPPCSSTSAASSPRWRGRQARRLPRRWSCPR